MPNRERRLRRLGGAAMLAAMLLAAGAADGEPQAPPSPPGSLPAAQDDFEDGLDADVWWPRGIPNERFWIEQRHSRAGRRSLAITVRPEDRDPRDPRIQRNELWLQQRWWDATGAESWYGFSFRIARDGAAGGDVRWVIGQWKEDGDRSPFLAQRFNGGVFRITVQDNDCQVTIASERPEAVGRATLDHAALSPQEIALGLVPRGCTPDIRLEPGESAGALPCPVDGWVDMVYRVRRGRDGQGLVQVWANGRLVVTARGSIGNAGAGPRTYFKIGMYRDPIADVATLYVDNFRRGRSFAEVDPAGEAP